VALVPNENRLPTFRIPFPDRMANRVVADVFHRERRRIEGAGGSRAQMERMVVLVGRQSRVATGVDALAYTFRQDIAQGVVRAQRRPSFGFEGRHPAIRAVVGMASNLRWIAVVLLEDQISIGIVLENAVVAIGALNGNQASHLVESRGRGMP